MTIEFTFDLEMNYFLIKFTYTNLLHKKKADYKFAEEILQGIAAGIDVFDST
jgi:hypothetical protein